MFSSLNQMCFRITLLTLFRWGMVIQQSNILKCLISWYLKLCYFMLCLPGSIITDNTFSMIKVIYQMRKVLRHSFLSSILSIKGNDNLVQVRRSTCLNEKDYCSYHVLDLPLKIWRYLGIISNNAYKTYAISFDQADAFRISKFALSLHNKIWVVLLLSGITTH